MNGKEFELIRVELGLNQTQLGEMLEKGKDTICRIESKSRVPELYKLAILKLKKERAMNLDKFRKNLVAKFTNGYSEFKAQDGFYVGNIKEIDFCGSESQGRVLTNKPLSNNEQLIFSAVQDFMINFFNGLSVAGIEVPEYLTSIKSGKNDVDFYDDFVRDVFLEIGE